jgi:hypothetical protein
METRDYVTREWPTDEGKAFSGRVGEYYIGIDFARDIDCAVAMRKLEDGSFEVVAIVQHCKDGCIE